MDPDQLRRRTFTLMIGVLFAAGQASGAQVPSVNLGLAHRLQRLVHQGPLPSRDLSLLVVEKEKGHEKKIFALNANRPRIPASLTKILTAGAALTVFPPEYSFKTKLLSNAPIFDGHLKGDLYLRGGGDPSFVSESMWDLVDSFVRTGIKVVDGSIVVDDTLMDHERFDPSREKERVDRAYDAPVGAMSFNWNSVNVFVRPGPGSGKPALVFADPENSYIDLVNHVRTGSPKSKTTIFVDRIAEKKNDKVIVSGSIAAGHGEVVKYVDVTHPALWSGANLQAFLLERGIHVRGGVREGRTPSGARVLATFKSPPIRTVVADMAKFSNNFVAEMLTKDLAVYKGETAQGNTSIGGGHTVGTMQGGLDVIRQFLGKVGLSPDQYTLVNPSGFTRKNQIRVTDFCRVLEYLKHTFTVYPEFLSALPIGGIDGTLEHRMSDEAGWVRAKTGLLDGVVGLAGFAARPDGMVFSFAFIYNGTPGTEAQARALFDKLTSVLTGR